MKANKLKWVEQFLEEKDLELAKIRAKLESTEVYSEREFFRDQIVEILYQQANLRATHRIFMETGHDVPDEEKVA